jgi:hypothetical protein
MKTLITATALILSMTAAADATDPPKATDVLGSGPIFDINETGFYCEFVNLGTSNITPIAQQVFEDSSTNALSTNSNCANDSPVAPNQTCIISPSSSVNDVSLSCKVTFSGAATNVRGAFELYDNSLNALATVELR